MSFSQDNQGYHYQQQQQQQPECSFMSTHFDQSPEAMILQSAQHLTNPHAYLDPALGGSIPQSHPYPDPSPYPPIAPQESSFSTFDVPVAPMNNSTQNETPDPETKPSKAKVASLQNDLELRKMFEKERNRTLQDVAAQLVGNERGPNSEKIRQTFAMIWLNGSCKKEEGSVPRGRVYSSYVQRCGDERVTVLNPASFGKLVRVMFPNISTRRLGMRGESKYHYCGLVLLDDQTEMEQSRRTSSNKRSQSVLPQQQQLVLPQDTAVFPIPSSTRRPSPPTAPAPVTQSSASLVFQNSWAPNFDIHSNPPTIRRELRFSSKPLETFSEQEPLNLPNIRDFVAPETDRDTTNALVAIYRTHCTTLIDCVRFCRHKNFFHSISSFHGTLTVPVQKLLAQQSVAAWIRQCDWIMYQKMIMVVAPLTLQVVPQPIMDFFRSISETLCKHILISFCTYPDHVIAARIEPATILSSLLDRLLKVNLTAHAAANMLCNVSNREVMYEEWVRFVQPIKVVESELFGKGGHTKLFNILSMEIKSLLSPFSEPLGLSDSPHAHPPSSDSSTDGVLDRWAGFIASLQGRFPRADACTIIQTLNSVGTACLRTITMGGGNSFGSWWITKTWLDEMAHWLAEVGGFLEHVPGDDVNLATTYNSHELHHDSRFSSISDDFNSTLDSHGTGLNTTTQSSNTLVQASAAPALHSTTKTSVKSSSFGTSLDHDDSGIGMRMSDEESSMGKFDFNTDPAGHIGSDPMNGDVVVC
ncbi:MAG: hypothetical protein M1814_006126 [Vezdaea aestivalis]|nr:MAG: hypothetical protein M1814_006126 [Vezdaea aestivalis]